MAKAKFDLTTLLLVAPLLGKAVDEIDDVFKPGGFKKKEVLEAVSKSLTALSVMCPELQRVPRAALLQAVGGLMDAAEGMQALLAWAEKEASFQRVFGDLPPLGMESK